MQRGRLECMSQGQWHVPFAGAKCTDAGKEVTQAAFKARMGRQLILGLAAHQRLDGGVSGPKIGPPQGPDAGNVHQALGFLFVEDEVDGV